MTFLDKFKQRIQEVADTTFASDDVVSVRLNICNSCEFLFKPTRNCKKCGCFIDGKTRLLKQKCPLDKW